MGCFEKLKILARDPEYFLKNNYQRYKHPAGFRLELLLANKYSLILSKLKWNRCSNLKPSNMVQIQPKGEPFTTDSFQKGHLKKTFCPYCEKIVIPKRLHRLDMADFMIILFTAGLWAIFLLFMYLFIRRCPVCNYNLRGFKNISEKQQT